MTKRVAKIQTLCLIHDNDHILLGMKKRGFGANRWNGFGGKMTDGETIEQTAIRELEEEIGIIATSLGKRGIINFNADGWDETIEMHIFEVQSYEGEPTETEEMRPEWFPKTAIPYQDMWPDDYYWLPVFLAGKKFKATFKFDNANTTVLKQKVQEVASI